MLKLHGTSHSGLVPSNVAFRYGIEGSMYFKNVVIRKHQVMVMLFAKSEHCSNIVVA